MSPNGPDKLIIFGSHNGSIPSTIKDMFVCKKNIQVRNMYVLHRHLKKVYANKPYDLILKLFLLLCSMGFEKSIF